MFDNLKKNKSVREFRKAAEEEKKTKEKDFLEFLASNSRNGTRVIWVEKVSERMFYDTDWRIGYLDLKTRIFESVEIVRRENDKLEEICKALDGLERFDRESIKTLDKRSTIYYD